MNYKANLLIMPKRDISHSVMGKTSCNAFYGSVVTYDGDYILVPRIPYWDLAIFQIEFVVYEPMKPRNIPDYESFGFYKNRIIGIARLYKPNEYGLADGLFDYTQKRS